MTIRFTALYALAPLALALSATAVQATDEQIEVTIQTHDLDLSNPVDRVRLNTRIRSEARNICRSGLVGIAADTTESRCFQAALASAQPQAQMAVVRAGNPVRVSIAR